MKEKSALIDPIDPKISTGENYLVAMFKIDISIPKHIPWTILPTSRRYILDTNTITPETNVSALQR